MVEDSKVKLKTPSHLPLDFTLHEKFVILLDFTLVSFSLICVGCGAVCLVLSDIDLDAHEFSRHGMKYAHLFYSLWGSVVQMIYFFMRLGVDLIRIFGKDNEELYKKGNKLSTVASYLFYSAVFPMSVSIVSNFWAMYNIDRELIYPKLLDEVYPFWVNHAMHTIPIFLCFLYLYIEKDNEPQLSHSLIGITVILFTYGVCISYVKMRDDKWMYYALHQFDEIYAYSLLVAMAASNITMTIAGHNLSRIFKGVSLS